jgi:hypothetical protein
METQRVQMKRGSSLVGLLGLSSRHKRFLFSLAALVGPLQYILTFHYFNSFVPIAQQAGQAAVLGHLFW